MIIFTHGKDLERSPEAYPLIHNCRAGGREREQRHLGNGCTVDRAICRDPADGVVHGETVDTDRHGEQQVVCHERPSVGSLARYVLIHTMLEPWLQQEGVHDALRTSCDSGGAGKVRQLHVIDDGKECCARRMTVTRLATVMSNQRNPPPRNEAFYLRR